MELKRYQRRVLRDIEEFIDQCNATRNIPKAFSQYWLKKGVELADGTDLQPYQGSVPGVPRVTVKVPTAGGKTFIACNALEKMFSTLEVDKPKVVVWFVPSDPILQQTIRRLKDSTDPYRQRIDTLFGGAVGVYDKEELLRGTNFDPVTVKEQLTIAVLSIDSFAATDKESRRVRRENENLQEFGEDSLIDVLASLNPVVVIDESHNFRSTLRNETLRDINPSFILELTATPRESSNIISFVDAKQLKDEHMVKLPVIVYNNRSKLDVLTNSIQLRDNLEKQAAEMERQGGKYIRPIVLFQAQPRTSSDSETFDKIKRDLVDLGIPEEQIKIKTADKDELKNVDLMSRNCPVRYIITVNALKEGWDCPFAYILASLANRTSKVDVEQILGRILRLPYTTESKSEFLNMGYVFTSSADFQQTIAGIIDGLQNSGFSAKDYRAAEIKVTEEVNKHTTDEERNLFSCPQVTDGDDTPIDPADEIDVTLGREILSMANDRSEPSTVAEILTTAASQNADFTRQLAEEEKNQSESNISLPTKVRGRNEARMKPMFKESAEAIALTVFEIHKPVTNHILFSDTVDDHIWLRLEKEHLWEGFNINSCDRNITFNLSASSAVKVDLEERQSDEFVPKVWTLNPGQMQVFKSYIDSLPPEGRINQLTDKIAKSIHGVEVIGDAGLQRYIKDVISTLDNEKIGQLTDNIGATIDVFELKIKSLLHEYSVQRFEQLLDQQQIRVSPTYRLPKTINPIPIDRHGLSKSLYTEEGTMNDFEASMIRQISTLPNVEFWHRNLERGKGFCINGYIHQYPDFIVKLKSGKIILIESKGDDRDNSNSREKIRLGKVWADESGKDYRYYMVFGHNDNLDGSITIAQLLDRLQNL